MSKVTKDKNSKNEFKVSFKKAAVSNNVKPLPKIAELAFDFLFPGLKHNSNVANKTCKAESPDWQLPSLL